MNGAAVLDAASLDALPDAEFFATWSAERETIAIALPSEDRSRCIARFRRLIVDAGSPVLSAPEDENGPRPKTAAWLLGQAFRPMRWVLPGILPEGLFILAAPPKIGKSWLMLQAELAVVCGGEVLGRTAPVGEALYLALEDNDRRMQSRLLKHGANLLTREQLARFHYLTEWPNLAEGGAIALAEWLRAHPAARLVVIDTLQRIRPPRGRNEDLYASDYKAIQELKAVADGFNVAMVIVHHVRKAEAADPLDLISGSNGLAGSADGAIVLKRMRGQEAAELHLIGRDVEDEGALAVEFRRDDCRWHLLGKVTEIARNDQQQQILDLLREHGAMTPAGVANRLSRDRDTVKKQLSRMRAAGLLTAIDGAYTVPSR